MEEGGWGRGVVKGRGLVVRHLASGVLGPNAPPPFQKNSLKQTLVWDGKDDLGEDHREPGKLVVRVSLGLKPEIERETLDGYYHAERYHDRSEHEATGGARRRTESAFILTLRISPGFLYPTASRIKRRNARRGGTV